MMSPVREARRLRNAEKARKEMDKFAEDFCGTPAEFLNGVMEIMVGNTSLKYFCEKADVPYDTMSSTYKRKRGCTLATLEDVLKLSGFDLRAVRRDA